jgi:hypothetical protein
MSTSMEGNQVVVYGCIDLDCTEVKSGISRPHHASNLEIGIMLAQNPIGKCDQQIVMHFDY